MYFLVKLPAYPYLLPPHAERMVVEGRIDSARPNATIRFIDPAMRKRYPHGHQLYGIFGEPVWAKVKGPARKLTLAHYEQICYAHWLVYAGYSVHAQRVRLRTGHTVSAESAWRIYRSLRVLCEYHPEHFAAFVKAHRQKMPTANPHTELLSSEDYGLMDRSGIISQEVKRIVASCLQDVDGPEGSEPFVGSPLQKFRAAL